MTLMQNFNIWHPIQTAPKDQTKILAFENGNQAVIFWLDLPNDCSRWIVDNVREDEGFDPTHWMPLPSPPEGL